MKTMTEILLLETKNRQIISNAELQRLKYEKQMREINSVVSAIALKVSLAAIWY